MFHFVRIGEQKDVVLSLVIAFAVIMLSEFGQRTFQRAFAEQDQFRQAFLLSRSVPNVRQMHSDSGCAQAASVA